MIENPSQHCGVDLENVQYKTWEQSWEQIVLCSGEQIIYVGCGGRHFKWKAILLYYGLQWSFDVKNSTNEVSFFLGQK